MRITSSVGNVYNIISREGDVYRVADTQTNQFVGFVGYACYKGICVNGPMTPEMGKAKHLAWFCAYNRYHQIKTLAHSKSR